MLDYLLRLQELQRVRQLVASRKEALGELAEKFSSSLIVSEPNLISEAGLASSLWQGLQVAMFSAVTNLDLLETAVTGLRSGVSSLSSVTSVTSAVPAPGLGMGQVLDDTGLLLLHNGRVVLGNL